MRMVAYSNTCGNRLSYTILVSCSEDYLRF